MYQGMKTIRMQEVKKAVSGLKNVKASGLDNLTDVISFESSAKV